MRTQKPLFVRVASVCTVTVLLLWRCSALAAAAAAKMCSTRRLFAIKIAPVIRTIKRATLESDWEGFRGGGKGR